MSSNIMKKIVDKYGFIQTIVYNIIPQLNIVML